MTENEPSQIPPESATPPVSPPDQPPLPADAKPPAKKKRRLWLKIPLALVLLLTLLVLLLPTLASTGMVRSIVVGKINDQLNGKLDIADWSFGWTTGARIDGVKVTDADGKQILGLQSIDAPISVLGALRGNYNLNRIVIDGLDFHAVREADGSLNFAKLAKSPPASRSPEPSPASPSPPAPSEPPFASSTSAPRPAELPKLPDIRGEIVITHCTGAIDDVQAKTTARLTSLEADVKIPDINQPVEDTFDAILDNGKGATGKISAAGKILVVKNNVVLTDPAQLVRQADIDQKATLSGFDLATIAPFLGPDAGISELAGISDGQVTIRLKPASDADVSAMLHLAKLAVGGKALKGDTFAAQSLEVLANHIALVLPADAKDVDSARIRTGPTDGSDPISVTLLQDGGSKSTITLFADVAQSSLARIAKNLSPGENGTIRAAVDLDLAHLATSMPHMFDLQKGLSLKSGRLIEGTTIDLTADKLALRQTLSLTGVAGRNSVTQTDVALQPIDLNVSANSLGGGGPLPDLRNLKLNLTSGFATASAQAGSIDDLSAELHATLQQVQSELGQIIDFGKNQLAGTLDIAVSSRGNLLGGASTAPAHTAALDVHGTLKDLKLSGDGRAPVSEPLTQFAVIGQLHGSDQQPIEQLSGLDLTAMAGDAQHPTLDTHITAALAFEKAAGAKAQDATTAVVLQQATIQKLNVDLALVQQQFGALIPALSNVHIGAGMFVVGGFAKRNGSTTHTIIQAYLQNVDMQKLPDAKGGAPVALLNGYVLHLLADASLVADSTGSQFNLAKLEVDDNQKLLSVQKTDAQLQLTTGSGADARTVALLDMPKHAEASISIPSLATLSGILNALSPADEKKVATADAAPAAPAKPKAAITAGSATITLAITRGDGQLKISPRVNISNDLAVAAGTVSQTVGPIDLATDIAITPANLPVSINPAAPAPTLLDQIKQLDISDLSAHAVGTEITLKQPLHITDVEGLTRLIPSTQPSAAPSGPAPSLSASLLVKGDIAPITHLLETLDAAAAGSEYPYTGAFQLDETVGTANGNMTVNGQGDVTQFVLHNGNAVSFSESDIHLATDLGLESGGKNLKIGGISLEMKSSNALAIAIKGALLDLAAQRTFQGVTADLTYDAAPLWKIVLPLLSKDTQEQFNDAVVSGKFTKHFTVTGSFPAAGELNDRIRNLSASGGLELAVFQGQGIDLQKLNVPIFMKSGKVFIANSDKPGDYAPPASMNGGTLSLSGVTVDLGDPHRVVSMNPNSQLMQNVGLNTALSHLLGKDFGNFLFADAGASTGIMNVTVEKCDQVPTDDTLKQNVPSNKGTMAMDVSIQDLTLSGGGLGKAIDEIGPLLSVISKGKGVASKSIKGSVKNYKITLAHGITTHDMTITLGEHQRSMHLTSTVDLLKLQLKNTFLTLPVSLFGISDDQWPNGINLALTGTATSPKFDAAGAVQKSVLGGGGNPLDLLNNVFGGKKKKGGNN